MNRELLQLANRIRQEMTAIDYTLNRATAGLAKSMQNADDLYLDGIALNLHGFYSGIERLFERIAVLVDNNLPQGANWHQLLLQQMAEDVQGVRPAVISDEIRHDLDEYRGFRHIVRNVYAYKFNALRLGNLTRKAPVVFDQLRKEMYAFADFLESSAEDTGELP